jgi:hypothetical protein
MLRRAEGVLKNGPDVSAAARSGAPTMTPASESGDETLGMALQPSNTGPTTSTVGNNAAVETVTPGSPNALPNPPATDAAPASSDSTPAATTDSSQPASTDSSNGQSSNSTNTAAPANSSQESSSKKKGGLRKLIPF